MNLILILTLAVIIMALAAFALPLLNRRRLIQAENDTYDAAVETHDDSVKRTNDAAITTRHLLWTQGATAAGVALNGAATIPLGTIDNVETSTGLNQTVFLLGGDRTRKVVASEAIAAGARVFGAASGKVAASGTVFLGTALTAAGADGDILELQSTVPVQLGLAEVVTTTNVITAAETGTTFYLNSATEFVSTLPAPALGLRFTFIVTAAPSGASYTIVTNSSANVIKGAIFTSDVNSATDADLETSGGDTITLVDAKAVAGDRVELFSDGTSWFAHGFCTVFDAITITTAS